MGNVLKPAKGARLASAMLVSKQSASMVMMDRQAGSFICTAASIHLERERSITATDQWCVGVLMQIGKQVGTGPSRSSTVESNAPGCAGRVPCLLLSKSLVHQ